MTDLRRASDIVLGAFVVWREARGEPRVAKLGVAHAIMNRVRAPGWWGSDVPTVIGKALQFSSLTDPHDRQLTKYPRWDPAWQECLEVMEAAYDRQEDHPAPGADTYHDLSIETPTSWGNPPLVAQLGRLKFFNLGKDPA